MTEPIRHARMRAITRPSLSVLCGIHRNGALAAGCLEPLRGCADEIIVAFDARTDPEQLGPLESIADRIVGYQCGRPDGFRWWLREQAAGDWLLLLDGDDTVSEQLLRQLPALLEDRNVAGYSLPRRWSYRAPGLFLSCAPWDLDRGLRLVRNDGRLRFAEGGHGSAICDPPTRIAGAPILHLGLLIDDEATRRARVAASDSGSHDGPDREGTLRRRACELPEDSPSITVAATPESDALRIQKILALSGERWPLASRPSVASQDEVDRYWPGKPFDEADYSARAQARQVPSVVAGSSRITFEVDVTNTGGHLWQASALDRSGHPVKAAYHWLHPDGSPAIWDGMRSPLPCRLIPGASITIELQVMTPPEPGEYLLCVDLVHEGLRWFGLAESVRISVRPTVTG